MTRFSPMRFVVLVAAALLPGCLVNPADQPGYEELFAASNELTGVACLPMGSLDGGGEVSACNSEESAKCPLGCQAVTVGNTSTAGCCDP